MNSLMMFLMLASASRQSPRYAELALTCDGGCTTADSALVAEALRVGLAHEGVTVVQARSAKDNLPLVVSARIKVEGQTIRVFAELLELDRSESRSVSRYALAAPREDVPAQLRRVGERFGRALFGQ